MLTALSVTMAAATTTFYQISRLSRRNHDRLQALQAGLRELERARSGAFQHDGIWASHVRDLTDGECMVNVTDAYDPALLDVSVEITWRDPDGNRRMRWSTQVVKR